MLKKKREESLADKISGVLSVTPAVFDSEDEDVDNTRARIVSADTTDLYDNESEEVLLRNFRTRNIDLIADFDERYSGVKTSRKELYSSEGEQSESDGVQSESDESHDEENTLKEKIENGSEEDDEEEENITKSDYEESDSEGSDRIGEDEEDFEDENEMQESDIKTMSENDVSSQIRKGLSVRNQMQMWESLLEMRIQLQKSLITAHKMPQGETFKEIKKSSGSEFSDQVAVTKNSLVIVLEKLLFLQKLVLKKYPETKNLDNSHESKANTDEDEEIPSDTDEETDEVIEEEKEVEDQPKKRRKLNEFAEEINERHNQYKSYRNSVIQKWNEKTRIAVIKNNTNAPSVLNHIEHILSDREKLIKRTQLKRSEYTILGQEPVGTNEQQKENYQESKRTSEYNTEIFDDDDFYHQLLRELIEVKSADLTDPVQLSRQWIQLQNLRSKMKRKVDTRATKGRKIRYAVHTKLVNFMAPQEENLWTEQAKNELFNSLFGKLECPAVL